MPATATSALRALIAAAALCLVSAAPAAASTISLSRSPAPPATLRNDGTQALSWNASIDFGGSAPDRYTVDVRAQDGGDCLEASNTRPAWFGASSQPVSLAGASGSYSTGSRALAIPTTASYGRYCLIVSYFEQSKTVFSSRAAVAFDVSDSVGSVVLVSYEDLNGDGRRQDAEPGLPGVGWQLTAPTPTRSTQTTSYSTATDGTVTVPDSIAGSYTAAQQPLGGGWTVTADAAQNFALRANATARVEVGQARPTQICGRVYDDVNASDSFDAADTPLSSVSVEMTGRPAVGRAVTAQAATAADGIYCLDGVLPGSYTVTESIPTGYAATFDADGAANGLNHIEQVTVISGVPSAANDFAVASTRAAAHADHPSSAGTHARARLCVTKQASRRRVSQGGAVTWTIRVRNCSKRRAVGVTVTDPLASDMTLRAHHGGRVRAGTLVFDLGTIKPAKAKTVRFTVRADAAARPGRRIDRAAARASNAPPARATARVRVISRHARHR